MNSLPKVTMIIISYNEKEYLSRAIGSCLRQTYKNKEIIVGDDGSTDGSLDLIKSYEGLRYFVMSRDEKPECIIPSIRVSNIIKRAIDLTDGKYYVILSGDDYYVYDDMLKDAVSYLEMHKDVFAYVYGYQKVTQSKVLKIKIPNRYSETTYWSGDYLHISCFVFRRIASEELLPRMCDDTGLEYVLAAKGRWKYSKIISFAYFQREASIMHQADKMELAILELMVFQDILNWRGKSSVWLKASTYSKYYDNLVYYKKNRNNWNVRYNKYLISSSNHKNNILNNPDVLLKGRRLFLAWLCHNAYGLKRKILGKPAKDICKPHDLFKL